MVSVTWEVRKKLMFGWDTIRKYKGESKETYQKALAEMNKLSSTKMGRLYKWELRGY